MYVWTNVACRVCMDMYLWNRCAWTCIRISFMYDHILLVYVSVAYLWTCLYEITYAWTCMHHACMNKSSFWQMYHPHYKPLFLLIQNSYTYTNIRVVSKYPSRFAHTIVMIHSSGIWKKKSIFWMWIKNARGKTRKQCIRLDDFDFSSLVHQEMESVQRRRMHDCPQSRERDNVWWVYVPRVPQARCLLLSARIAMIASCLLVQKVLVIWCKHSW